MARAFNSGIKLEKKDAAIVKGMLHRGDRQHDIAAWFGVNGGRIAEISSRRKFSDVLMQRDRLPPPGPYLTGKQTHQARQDLLELMSSLDRLAKENIVREFSDELETIIEKMKSIIEEF